MLVYLFWPQVNDDGCRKKIYWTFFRFVWNIALVLQIAAGQLPFQSKHLFYFLFLISDSRTFTWILQTDGGGSERHRKQQEDSHHSLVSVWKWVWKRQSRHFLHLAFELLVLIERSASQDKQNNSGDQNTVCHCCRRQHIPFAQTRPHHLRRKRRRVTSTAWRNTSRRRSVFHLASVWRTTNRLPSIVWLGQGRQLTVRPPSNLDSDWMKGKARQRFVS